MYKEKYEAKMSHRKKIEFFSVWYCKVEKKGNFHLNPNTSHAFLYFTVQRNIILNVILSNDDDDKRYKKEMCLC